MMETLPKVVAEKQDGNWPNSGYNLKIDVSGFAKKSDVG